MKAKPFLLAGLSCLLIGSIGLASSAVHERYQLTRPYQTQFLPGTTFNHIQLDQLTVEEALLVIEADFTEQMNRILTLSFADDNVSQSLGDLGLQYEQDPRSFLISLLEKQAGVAWWEQWAHLQAPALIPASLALQIDNEQLLSWVDSLPLKWNQELTLPSLILDATNTPIYTEGVTGIDIDVEATLDTIQGELSFPWSEDKVVTVIYQTHDIPEAYLNLSMVQDEVGIYESWFDPTLDRAKNVRRSAALIHNTLLLPGERFSYADLTLPASIENGYGYGTIFLNGKSVPGLGGGMCQTSSTLYNAMLEAGILATDRTNHSLPVGYVPAGQDATMNDSGLDLIFENPYEVPLLIQATASEGGVLRIVIWSNLEVLNGLDYQAHTLKVGERSYDTYLRAYEGAQLIFEEFLHRSTYKASY